MDKELIELFEVVKKAADAAAVDGVVDSSPEEGRCLDALKQLKKFPVNYQVLVSSQVGKRLRQLTKHPRKKIQALASDVVEIWKTIIVQETMKNKVDGTGDAEVSVKAESTGERESKKLERVNSVNSVKAEKVSRKDSVKVERSLQNSEKVKSEASVTEKRIENSQVIKKEKSTARESVTVERTTKERVPHDTKPKSDPAAPPKLNSVLYCKDSLRDKVRELLAEALCKVSGEVEDHLIDEVNACDPHRVAVLVETAMFEKWGKSTGAQKFKYRSIMFNMKDPNNPDFRRKVLLGQYQPRNIPELTPDDMASDARQKQNEKIKEKALFECERGIPAQASTDQFKCGRCGQRKTTYYQLQTRSADEPMTTFVTCVNCNNHWKFC